MEFIRLYFDAQQARHFPPERIGARPEPVVAARGHLPQRVSECPKNVEDWAYSSVFGRYKPAANRAKPLGNGPLLAALLPQQQARDAVEWAGVVEEGTSLLRPGTLGAPDHWHQVSHL